MADEDDIRELIGRMSAAQRQGFHVTPAHIRLLLTALRFYLAARTWLVKPQSAEEPSPVHRTKAAPPSGRLPTIADSRRLGVTAVHIHCAGPFCHQQRRLTFDDLRLGDDVVFVDIRRLRRFRCVKCGSRKVEVSADWTGLHKSGENTANLILPQNPSWRGRVIGPSRSASRVTVRWLDGRCSTASPLMTQSPT